MSPICIGLPNASLLYVAHPTRARTARLALPLRTSRRARALRARSRSASSLAAGVGGLRDRQPRHAAGRRARSARRRRTGSTAPTSGPRASSRSRDRNISPRHKLESWNRTSRASSCLAPTRRTRYPSPSPAIRSDGTLEIDGQSPAPRRSSSTSPAQRSTSKGRVVARPRDDLVAYRIPAGAHVRSLAGASHRTAGPGTDSLPRLARRHVDDRTLRAHLSPRRGHRCRGRRDHSRRQAAAQAALRPPARRSTSAFRPAAAPTEALGLSIDVPDTPLDGRVLGAEGLRAALRDGQAHVRRATPKRLKRPRPHRAAHRPCRCAPT